MRTLLFDPSLNITTKVKFLLSLSLGITGRTTIGTAGGMITRPDGRHRPRRAAVPTIAKVQPRSGILDELRIGTATHLTRHVLDNVLAEEGFNVLGHVLAADDESLVAIDGALGTKLGHEELEHMFGRTLHHGADLLEVDPERLFGTDAGELRWFHVATLLLD